MRERSWISSGRGVAGTGRRSKYEDALGLTRSMRAAMEDLESPAFGSSIRAGRLIDPHRTYGFSPARRRCRLELRLGWLGGGLRSPEPARQHDFPNTPGGSREFSD